MSLDKEIKKFALLIGIEEDRLREFIKSAAETTHPDKDKAAKPPVPSDLPKESYSTSPEAQRGGGGIVAYLERVWLPVMQQAPGSVDLRLLRTADRSAVTAIDNYKRRRPLPAHLNIPTKRELVDRELASFKPDAVLPARTADRLARARRRRPRPALTT